MTISEAINLCNYKRSAQITFIEHTRSYHKVQEHTHTIIKWNQAQINVGAIGWNCLDTAK